MCCNADSLQSLWWMVLSLCEVPQRFFFIIYFIILEPQLFMSSHSSSSTSCFPPDTRLEWLPYSSTAFTDSHTLTQESDWPGMRMPQFTVFQLSWRSVGRELHAAFMESRGILHITLWRNRLAGQRAAMELGRVWSRFQRMLLITMMMFKLGKMWTFLVPPQWNDHLETGCTFWLVRNIYQERSLSSPCISNQRTKKAPKTFNFFKINCSYINNITELILLWLSSAKWKDS